jgi:hypothetical protein
MHRHRVAVSLLLLLPLTACSAMRPGTPPAESRASGDCSHHVAAAHAHLAVPGDSAAAVSAAHSAHAAAMHEYHRCLAR